MSIVAGSLQATDLFDIARGPVGDSATRGFDFIDVNETLEDPRRLELIRSTGLLTARHRPALDAITHLAAEVTDAQAAIVSLVDADRQVFPSFHQPGGQEEAPTETPISHSFCKYVVMNDAPLVVEDARTHPVLSSHPAVLDGLLVSYAGFPVRAPDGQVLGALCAIDMRPRTWSSAHLSGLQDLATSVDTKIALRLSRRERRLDHERLMHVLDGALHTLILITDREGVITNMNRAAKEILTSPSEGATRTLFELVEDQQRWDDGFSLDRAHDWVFRTPDGEQRIFSVRVNVLRDLEGDIDGYIVVGDDVSVRRHAEALLRDTVSKQAAAVERLEALDAERRTFIATASHELRTPVTSIIGYTELLGDGHGGELAPQQRKLVDRLERNGRRLHHLIEDLLLWDRIGSGGPGACGTEVDVERLVEEVQESLRVHLTGRDLHMTVQVADGIPPVTGDVLQLERALLNVLTNAVKFTPDGGSVKLSVEHGPHSGVSFEVSDTGRGIAEADQQAVFEPFFRAREAHTHAVPGSGLGLAVVARIVESHGGQVALSSQPGEGTTVRFTLATSTQP